MACVWLCYDDGAIKPLYFFVGMTLVLVAVNSFGLSRVYGELHRVSQEP